MLPGVGSAEQLYFDPSLIAEDSQMVADLSRFEKSGAQLPGVYQVDVYVNGKFISNRDIRFNDVPASTVPAAVIKAGAEIKDNTGLMACLTRNDLDKLGVNTGPISTLDDVTEEQCLSPGKYIANAFTSFDFQNMRLDISIPQAVMKNNARGYISPESWEEGINALLLNYSFSGNNNYGRYGDSSSHYLNLTSGLNIGPWRFRDYRTWNQYESDYYRYRKWQRIQTYAQRSIIPLRSELVIGESTTNGDVFDSLGFRGVQIETDESMVPDSLKGFAPIVRGNALTNARVSIRQNGYSVYQTFVSPGAFVINDLFPVYASGDLEVTVTEADGSTQVFTVPYSSVPILQREGQIKYSLMAGRFQSSGDSYSNPDFMQGTLVWGLPYNTTVYSGVQYSKNYLSGLLGGGLNLGLLGALSVDATQASSTLADGSQHQGQSLRFLYARSLNSLGTTFQLTGYRYSTEGFHTLDETALKGMRGWLYDVDTVDAEGKPVQQPYTDYYNLYNTKRSKVQVNISQRVSELGSVYLAGTRQTYWNTSGASDSLQAGFSSSIGPVSYNLSYHYSRERLHAGSERSAFLSLSVPMNALLSGGADNRHSVYATYTASQDTERRVSHQAGLSGTALENNNLSWGVSQGYTRNEGNSGNLSTQYKGAYGTGNVGYSYSESYRQVNYGISGGGILHQDGLTLGQPLGETNILIAAPGVSGLSIENETGVKTDWRGYAIKPSAAVYRENRVALDMVSLDEQTDMDEAVKRVVPTRGAVAMASFKGHSGSRVLLTLTYAGKPLPFGTTVTSGERGSIVGDEGVVYLSGMAEEGVVQAAWGEGAGKQCSVHYRLPASKEKLSIIRLAATCK